MKFKKTQLIAVLFLTLALFCYGQESSDMTTQDPVTIFDVSTVMGLPNYQRSGSILGGTWIYIKAVGID
jgi:hypothetical protein